MAVTEAPSSDAAGELVKSGMSTIQPGAARSGYMPLPLDQVVVRALAGIPVYLQTSREATKQFTLYCAESARFTDYHRQRLREASVRFIYVPISHHAKFRRQVEKELESIAADPRVASEAKAALVYETSLELINEVLTEQGISQNMPRLESVSRAVSTLVVSNAGAFSHLYATAQHDFYTATHMVNVGTWMTSLAYALGMRETAELEAACTAGMIHDVGKMAVPETVLNKVGALSDQEWVLLKAHPLRGVERLKKEGVTSEVLLRVTMEHHERMDGSGYPNHLPGDQLHRMSRICAVVDSFDAMTSCRPFKNRVKTIIQAVKILQEETPSKYDPEVVEAWVGLLKRASDDGKINEPVEETATGLGRRAHPRFTVSCPVKTCILRRGAGGWAEGEFQEGKAHNISKGGIGLLLPKSANVGDYLRAYLKGKGSLQNRIVEGLIVRCRAYDDGWNEVGLRFCKPGEEEEAAAKASAAG